MTDESNLWTILNWLSPGSAPHRKQQAFDLITLHTKKADTKARIDEHSQLWDIVPSFTEHVETVQDISDLRVFKLEAQLTNPTERSEQ